MNEGDVRGLNSCGCGQGRAMDCCENGNEHAMKRH